MFRKMVLVVVVVLFVFITTACTWFIKDGQELTTKRETSCWDMPGGAKVSRISRALAQENQVNRGTIAQDTKVTAKSDDGAFSPISDGYVRVEALVYGVNPSTKEIIDLGQRICWVNGKDLKK